MAEKSAYDIIAERAFDDGSGIAYELGVDFDFKKGCTKYVVKGALNGLAWTSTAHGAAVQGREIIPLLTQQVREHLGMLCRMLQPLPKGDPGFTVMLNVGPWGGVYVHWSRWWIRLCLGFVAFSVYMRDMDGILVDWSERIAQGSKRFPRKQILPPQPLPRDGGADTPLKE